MIIKKDTIERAKAMLEACKNGTYVSPNKRNKPTSVPFDLAPCKNCGRIVYAGKCCDKPDNDVVINEILNDIKTMPVEELKVKLLENSNGPVAEMFNSVRYR